MRAQPSVVSGRGSGMPRENLGCRVSDWDLGLPIWDRLPSSLEAPLHFRRDTYVELLAAYRERSRQARRRIARLALLPGTFAPGLGYAPVPLSAAPT